MAEKMDADRIKEIYKLCKGHFGGIRFVGDGDTSTDALRKLRNRVKKIIKRYNGV